MTPPPIELAIMHHNPQQYQHIHKGAPQSSCEVDGRAIAAHKATSKVPIQRDFARQFLEPFQPTHSGRVEQLGWGLICCGRSDCTLELSAKHLSGPEQIVVGFGAVIPSHPPHLKRTLLPNQPDGPCQVGSLAWLPAAGLPGPQCVQGLAQCRAPQAGGTATQQPTAGRSQVCTQMNVLWNFTYMTVHEAGLSLRCVS